MVWSVLLILVLGSLVGLAAIWFLALRKPSGDAARCGSCGYRVAGLETFSCPECGSDLRSVGIQTPRRVFIRPLVFVVAWTILLPLPALVVTNIVFALMPSQGRVVSTIDLTVPGTTLPALELVHTMQARLPRGVGLRVGSATSLSSTDGSGTINTLVPPSIAGPATVEAQSFELLLASSSGGRSAAAPIEIAVTDGTPRAADLDGIMPWLLTRGEAAGGPAEGDAGGRPVAGDVADQADRAAAELRTIVTMLAAQGPPCDLRIVRPGSTAINARSRSTLEPWMAYGTAGLWLAVYAAGLVVFFRIHRRRVAAAGEDARTRAVDRS